MMISSTANAARGEQRSTRCGNAKSHGRRAWDDLRKHKESLMKTLGKLLSYIILDPTQGLRMDGDDGDDDHDGQDDNIENNGAAAPILE